MKIALGSKIYNQPWGGGNLFIKNLSEYLTEKGHSISFNLFQKDIDVILLLDPRLSSQNATFNHRDIYFYKKLVNPNVKVVHRINECDQRKNTSGLNQYYIKSNKVADHTVFVSEWLKKIYIDDGIKNNNLSVIMSGSDKNIFKNKNFEKWNGESIFKIVTHHWGSNKNKGFEIYKKLDELISKPEWKNKITFQFIGNINKDYEFQNTNITEPLSGIELANEIKQNNAYITASINEPSGNHHIESSQCGLPLLYVNSGGIPEFAKDFGLEFSPENLEEKILELMNNYSKYFELMKDYPFESSRMSHDYEKLFAEIQNKDDIKLNLFKFYLFNVIRYPKYFIKFNSIGRFTFIIYLKLRLLINKNKDIL